MANPNCGQCGGSGYKPILVKGKHPDGTEYEWLRTVSCGC